MVKSEVHGTVKTSSSIFLFLNISLDLSKLEKFSVIGRCFRSFPCCWMLLSWFYLYPSGNG